MGILEGLMSVLKKKPEFSTLFEVLKGFHHYLRVYSATKETETHRDNYNTFVYNAHLPQICRPILALHAISGELIRI